MYIHIIVTWNEFYDHRNRSLDDAVQSMSKTDWKYFLFIHEQSKDIQIDFGWAKLTGTINVETIFNLFFLVRATVPANI